MGSYLLEVLDENELRYIAFHVDVAGCRYCQASLADLKAQQSAVGQGDAATSSRRRRYFESSVGRLRK